MDRNSSTALRARAERNCDMRFFDDGLTAKATFIFSLANIAVFALYYIFSYVVTAPNDLVVYLIHFVTNAASLLIPLSAVAVLLVKRTYVSRSSLLISAIPFALCKILYLVPYYYMFFIYSGYDSVESLAMGAIWSIPEMLVQYLLTVLAVLGMRKISEFIGKRSGNNASPESLLAERGVLNLDNPTTFSILCISICTFVYLLVVEIINAISYFIEYAGSYRIDEILYIAVSFIYDVLMLLIVHTVMCIIKNAIISKRLDSGASERSSLI